MKICSCIQSFFSNPRCAITFLSGMALAALAIALTSQYVYGLQPCELCMFQRMPYAVIIALGIIGLFVFKSHKANIWVLSLIALAYFTDTVFAAYHTGVERKWWPSFLEGCKVPELKGNITDVLAQIAATPAVRCDEIPWTDPVLGWSMANYNVIVTLVLGIVAVYATLRSARAQ